MLGEVLGELDIIIKIIVSVRVIVVPGNLSQLTPSPSSTIDVYENLSSGSFFSYYLSLISLDFGKFSVTKVKKVAHFRLTNLNIFLLTVDLK